MCKKINYLESNIIQNRYSNANIEIFLSHSFKYIYIYSYYLKKAFHFEILYKNDLYLIKIKKNEKLKRIRIIP